MDSYQTTIMLLKIEADDLPPVYISNYPQTVTIGINTYIPQPQMVLDLPEKTGSVGGSECRIKDLDSSASDVIQAVSDGYPYNQVKITITEAVLDDAGAVVSSWYHSAGLLYQKLTTVGKGRTDFIVKDWKYYYDIPGGIPCTEFCFVGNFGDKICQAVVQEFPVVIAAISGNDVIVDSVPVVADFLFNKGYFKLDGTSIKIKFWQSGTTFQTSGIMPASWDGRVVSLVSGCDKSLATCRDIHNNEEFFSGWGYSMIDYNPQFEEPSK